MVVLEKLRCVPVHFTVWTVIFAAATVKITVHTVKCTETHRNISSAIINYPSAVFPCGHTILVVEIIAISFCFQYYSYRFRTRFSVCWNMMKSYNLNTSCSIEYMFQHHVSLSQIHFTIFTPAWSRIFMDMSKRIWDTFSLGSVQERPMKVTK